MIHLDARTGYSFMRGYGSAEDWVSRAKAIGAPALGISDYCSTWGHVPLRAAAAGSGVKIVYGVTLPVVTTLEKSQNHALVTLIAQGDIKALYDTVTLANKQSYYRPRIMWNQIDSSLVPIFTGGSMSDLMAFQRMGRGYLGLSPTKSLLMQAVEDFDIIATVSPVYPFPEQRGGFELVQAISDRQRMGETLAGGHHLLRQGEADALYKAAGINPQPNWNENIQHIVASATCDIPMATSIKIQGELQSLARRGLERRGFKESQIYQNRLEQELKIIKEKGFEDYFLFVADLVGWAKERMFVGPGRGSVGGSLIAYLIGISRVDPIRHSTRFDRFIDVGRSDLPDIDIDFPDTSRNQVFEYLKETYGDDKVARIGTLSLFGGKSAINDTARSTGVSTAIARQLGVLTEGCETLDEAFRSEGCKAILNHSPGLRDALLLEGLPRHHGKHAAGVCVTNEPITNFGAVDRDGVISLDLKMAEKVNLLKVDALGLRTLSVIDDCCSLIGMDPYDLTIGDDQDVWDTFNSNHLTGIFQFEGRAVRALTQQIKVDCFDDLCALTSLARPGPLMAGAADDWIKRRAGIEYEQPHPLVWAETSETYGLIVFQEQAMGIVRNIGGFDAVDVNRFRKAVGKKDPELLAAFREKFIEGSAGHITSSAVHNLPEEVAEQVWEDMCEFGSYAFNKSHAVAYSMISYYAAWLKTKHPLEFALAQLNSNRDAEHSKAILRELVEMGYEFVPFDPKWSEEEWTVGDYGIGDEWGHFKQALMGGFTGVHSIGPATARKMLEMRDKDPDGWIDCLTVAQRDKVLRAENTPWHDLSRMHERYQGLYDNTPETYEQFGLKWKPGRVVEDISKIEQGKGSHTFVGKLLRQQERDLNDPSYVSKRNGVRFTEATKFLNVFFEDDTGDIGCTISRWKFDEFDWLEDGKDYIIIGNIINDTGKWIFIEQIKELKNDTDTNTH